MLAVTPGWPDLEVIVPRDKWTLDAPWAPIYVELKTHIGQVSQNQENVLASLRQAGAHAFVCRSIDEITAAIGEFVRLDHGVTA